MALALILEYLSIKINLSFPRHSCRLILSISHVLPYGFLLSHFFCFPLPCLFPVSCFTCLHRFTMFYLIYHIVSYHAGWRLVGISPWASPSHSGGRGSNCPTLTIGGLVSGTSAKYIIYDPQKLTALIRKWWHERYGSRKKWHKATCPMGFSTSGDRASTKLDNCLCLKWVRNIVFGNEHVFILSSVKNVLVTCVTCDFNSSDSNFRCGGRSQLRCLQPALFTSYDQLRHHLSQRRNLHQQFAHGGSHFWLPDALE